MMTIDLARSAISVKNIEKVKLAIINQSKFFMRLLEQELGICIKIVSSVHLIRISDNWFLLHDNDHLIVLFQLVHF